MTYGSSGWRKWVLDEDESIPFIKRALELGINFFDTANMYSDGRSEEILGRALQKYAKREQVRRLWSTCFRYGFSSLAYWA